MLLAIGLCHNPQGHQSAMSPRRVDAPRVHYLLVIPLLLYCKTG